MKKTKYTLVNVLPWLLLISGIIGVFSAGMLTYEKIELLKHPNAELGCDLNPIVACGPVINKPQASAFGFPNPFIGLVGFAVVATVGGAMLAGAVFRRWFWLGLQAGVTFAVGFVTWLQFETIFRIHALCPYCMTVWIVTIPVFLYVTLYNLQAGHLKTPTRLKGAVGFARKHHGDILILWYLIIIGVILNRFWYYWKTLF